MKQRPFLMAEQRGIKREVRELAEQAADVEYAEVLNISRQRRLSISSFGDPSAYRQDTEVMVAFKPALFQKSAQGGDCAPLGCTSRTPTT